MLSVTLLFTACGAKNNAGKNDNTQNSMKDDMQNAADKMQDSANKTMDNMQKAVDDMMGNSNNK